MGSKKYLTFSLLIVGLLGCGSVKDSQGLADNAINAINVLNKSQFQELAEYRDREPISFTVVKNVAYMRGIMDSTIPHLVGNLLGNYPNVDTIVMQHVMGTLDFSATLEAGRLLRKACLTTVVPIEGKITSGGVHFFLAGCERIIENGAKLGVHTWKFAIYDEEENIIGGKTAIDFPIGAIEHKVYLDYQKTMNIPESFYWFVANTPFEKMRFLTRNEIEEFNISTNPAKSWGADYRLMVDAKSPMNFDSARFYVADFTAIMHGKISSRTPVDFLNMMADHPEVSTLEFGYVVNSKFSNIRNSISLGYQIRDACLKTKIGRLSYVVGDAIHAYIAGCGVEFENGAQLGISSWIEPDLEGTIDLENSTLHSDFLSYYDDMRVPQSFYFYQLDIPKSQPIFIDSTDLENFEILD